MKQTDEIRLENLKTTIVVKSNRLLMSILKTVFEQVGQVTGTIVAKRDPAYVGGR